MKELPPIPLSDWSKVLAEVKTQFGPKARVSYTDPVPFPDQLPAVGYIEYNGTRYPVYLSCCSA